jgi:transcriptional regulator with XRE-family HTH domain
MTASPQPSRRVPIGEAGKAVTANVERLRKAQHLSLRALSARLAELGRPIGNAVLHRQSQGRRRVDADDLVALACVLGVTPADLLKSPGTTVPDHPAVRAARDLADRVEALVRAAGDPQAAGRANRAMRRLAIEIEELLAAHPAYTAPRRGASLQGLNLGTDERNLS